MVTAAVAAVITSISGIIISRWVLVSTKQSTRRVESLDLIKKRRYSLSGITRLAQFQTQLKARICKITISRIAKLPNKRAKTNI